MAGSSAAKQQARAHEAELAHARAIAETASAPAAPAGGNALETLRKLAAAHDAGILTDAEFAAKVKEQLA